MKKWILPLVILILAVFLTNFIPFSGYFENVDTLVHESGHAIVTLLLSGHVDEIRLFSDHSGVTYFTIQPGWRQIPIALAGYMTASLFVVFLFRMYANKKQRVGLIVLSLIAVVSLAFFIRNGFGVYWTLGFIVVNLIATLSKPKVMNVYYLFMATLLIVHSFYSSVIILILSFSHPTNAGDAASLATSTHVPAAVFGILFAIMSFWCARRAMLYLVRKVK